MNLKIVKSIILVPAILLCTQSIFAEGYSIERCRDDQLNTKDGINRHQWGMTCVPQYPQDVYSINYILFEDKKINPVETRADGTIGRRFSSTEEMDFKVYVDEVGKDKVPEFGYPGFHHVKNGSRMAVWNIKNTKSSGSPCDVPKDVRYTRICPAGCYSGTQFIATSEGALPIADINEDKIKGIGTLAPESTMENIVIKETPLFKVVKDSVLSEQIFLTFKTTQGNIEVTPNHPMLTSNGYMYKAQKLKPGMSLMRQDGSAAQIIEILSEKKKAKAYNLISNSTNKLEKIVIAQGFLTGDLYFQNAGTKYLNRLLIRSQDLIPEGAL